VVEDGALATRARVVPGEAHRELGSQECQDTLMLRDRSLAASSRLPSVLGRWTVGTLGSCLDRLAPGKAEKMCPWRCGAR
jgi:hypothetical protein